MTDFLSTATDARTIRIVSKAERDAAVEALPDALKIFAEGFRGAPGETLLLPDGADADAWVGSGRGDTVFALGGAPLSLPEGDWTLDALPEGWDATQTLAAWGHGAYQFTRYKEAGRAPAKLVAPEGADAEEAQRLVNAARLVRDLVNTPAEDMGPEAIEDAVRQVAGEFEAEIRTTVGDDLLSQNYPMIHAVGRAADQSPRLIELEWGDESHPRLAVIGKGVAFDSGGLNIKTGNFMRLMKKDMGGAANALGLAYLIMSAKLPVRLHLLIPAVENAISGNAFRPGDIIPSRKGLSVEIDNTDAEGRLILGDALTRAAEDEPALMVDFATLTGAARVALGPEVAPFYTDDAELADTFAKAGETVADPLWRMPLWDGYDEWMDGSISDLVNGSGTPFAGSITAGLFLRRFVGETRWAHFDIFAWNPKGKPGRPAGGEMMAARAVYHSLRTHSQLLG